MTVQSTAVVSLNDIVIPGFLSVRQEGSFLAVRRSVHLPEDDEWYRPVREFVRGLDPIVNETVPDSLMMMGAAHHLVYDLEASP